MSVESNEYFDKLDILEPKDTPNIELIDKSYKVPHRNPFKYMKIDDNTFLNSVDGRCACKKCGKSRKFFCYTCHVAVVELESQLPKVRLPIKIDIIKHPREIDGKSTAVHAAVIAADDVKIYTYPDIPDYDTEGTVLVFPTHNSASVKGIFDSHLLFLDPDDAKRNKGDPKGTLLKTRLCEISSQPDETTTPQNVQYTLDNLPIKKAVFIDSTWNQCRAIFKDERIKRLRPIILQNRLSQFWRHQKGSPRWYLATIEAIHQLLIEIHINAYGLDKNYDAFEFLEVQTDFIQAKQIIETESNASNDTRTIPYNGQYDNLFFFFSHMFHLIHKYYDHNLLQAYKRPANLI